MIRCAACVGVRLDDLARLRGAGSIGEGPQAIECGRPPSVRRALGHVGDTGRIAMTEVLPLGPDVVPYGSTSAVCAESAARRVARRRRATEPSTDSTAGPVMRSTSRRPPSSRRVTRSGSMNSTADEAEGLLPLQLCGEKGWARCPMPRSAE